MTTLVLAVLIGVLFTLGVYQLLQRSLTRIIFGLAVLSHGANLVLLAAGGTPGRPPLIDGRGGPYSDPLPQAMALTAIVISFGVTAFLAAMAYRSYQLQGTDEVEDDIEDRRIARLEAVETDDPDLVYDDELDQALVATDDMSPEDDLAAAHPEAETQPAATEATGQKATR